MYLNRSSNQAEIANGQYGHYWAHAFLPDDHRVGLAEHDWGVIYVPDSQTEYLGTIESDLRDNFVSRDNLLVDLQNRQKQTICSLLELYKKLLIILLQVATILE